MKGLRIISILYFFSIFACLNSIWIDENPSCIIEGPETEINHPEGFIFSYTGDYIIVANANSNKIHFYDRLKDQEGQFQPIPSYEITGELDVFNYPHDMAISPNGEHLAVVCPGSNSVLIFKKSPNHKYFDAHPFFILQGKDCQLIGCSAVSYSPVEKILAVSNSKGNFLSLFKYDGDVYETYPFQIIPNYNRVLNRPDGIAFSNDGKIIGVTSHARHSVVLYIKDGNGKFITKPFQILSYNRSNLYFTHSLCFSPLDNSLIVSNASGVKTLNLFQPNFDQHPKYDPTPIQSLAIYNPETVFLQNRFPEEGGVKGVAFSPDGKYIGISASDIGEDNRAIMIFPVRGLD